MTHPWHDVTPGENLPAEFVGVVEIPTGSKVKYELDKETGLLRVDRVLYSAVHYPANYGFIPQTYCGHRVGALSEAAQKGDGDPLDICVVSERPITKSEVILDARVVGGLQMVDKGEADDKIVAVLENDNFWGEVADISELPEILVERLRHYFITYKLLPGRETQSSIEKIYAGGDIVLGAATVILAMGEGRKAAHAMNEMLAES